MYWLLHQTHHTFIDGSRSFSVEMCSSTYGRNVDLQWKQTIWYVRACVHACRIVCAYMHACVCVFMCMRVCVRVRACVCIRESQCSCPFVSVRVGQIVDVHVCLVLACVHCVHVNVHVCLCLVCVCVWVWVGVWVCGWVWWVWWVCRHACVRSCEEGRRGGVTRFCNTVEVVWILFMRIRPGTGGSRKMHINFYTRLNHTN